jgi:DNA-binding CsgD family transcriptional regulator
VTSRQAPSKVKTAQLESECLRLRLDGLTHREIAAQLGVAPATAYRRVHHALEEINQHNAEEAGMLRDLEALRLDDLQSAIWRQALDGDGGAINRILAIMTRRAKLFGLDAPTQHETKVSAPDAQAARTQRRLLVQQIIAEVTTEVDGPSH